MTSATIISDASFHPPSKSAGWAAWMKADGKESVIYSGAIKVEVLDSTHAELMAIANALAAATRGGYLERKANVLVQSDNVIALALVQIAVPGTPERKHPNGVSTSLSVPKRPTYLKRFQPQMRVVADLVAEFELTLAVRHVRGHTQGGGRQWVNRACDKAAKRARPTRQTER